MNGSENLFIPLRLTPGVEGVYLRSLRGADEMSVENTGTQNLINLLESLMQPATTGTKIHAAKIVTADRDRLLALLYMSLYGSKVESTVSCKQCRQKFDLDFSLNELLKHYHPSTAPFSDNGKYELESGISFRLPTGEDEMVINTIRLNASSHKLMRVSDE